MILSAILVLIVPLIPQLRARVERNTAADYEILVWWSRLAGHIRFVARRQYSDLNTIAAGTEMVWRILAADRRKAGQLSSMTRFGKEPRRFDRLLVPSSVVLAALAVAFLLYPPLSLPGLSDKPLRDRIVVAEHQRAGPSGVEMARPVDHLAQQLRGEPDDLGGWILFGREVIHLRRAREAAKAIGAAVKLAPDDAQLQAGYGEALTMAADGIVTSAAIKAFGESLKADPKNPRARFYRGLLQAQGNDLKGALDSWLALARDTPADAPWRETIVAHIKEARRQLGPDLNTDLPVAGGTVVRSGPRTDDVATDLRVSPDQRQRVVEGVVASPAESVEEQSRDFSDWLLLVPSQGQLGRPKSERDAFAETGGLEPDDPKSWP